MVINLRAEFGLDDAMTVDACVDACLSPMLPRGSETAFQGLGPRERKLLESLYSAFVNPVHRYPIAEPPAVMLGYGWSRSGVKRLAERIRRRENLPQLFAAVQAYREQLKARWQSLESQEDSYE